MLYQYLIAYGLGTVKFLFSQAASAAMGLNFVEVFLTTTSGALTSFFIFYKGSKYFIERAQNKKRNKMKKLILQGKPIPPQKHFKRRNKWVVKIKKTMGIKGVAILFPLFLSIPLGSIIAAKFFGKFRATFWISLTTIVLYSLTMSIIMTFVWNHS